MPSQARLNVMSKVIEILWFLVLMVVIGVVSIFNAVGFIEEKY